MRACHTDTNARVCVLVIARSFNAKCCAVNVYLFAWWGEAQSCNRASEFFLIDGARAILVPRAKQVDSTRQVGICVRGDSVHGRAGSCTYADAIRERACMWHCARAVLHHERLRESERTETHVMHA